MRFKTSFDLRTICGETVLIATGAEHVDFGHLINLNETAADVDQLIDSFRQSGVLQ